MASLNKVMLIGNAGRDAELRYTANGTAQSNFSLAVNNRRRSQSGDWEEHTEWFNIIIFGDMAERVSQYITKGKSIYAEGRLQTRTWDEDQGVKHYRTEVIANTIQLLGGRDSAGDGGGGGGWGDGERSFAGRGQQGARGTGGPRSIGAPAGGNAPTDIDDLPFE
ncbi:MAG: single-stranded DNA-binding protein [Gemmataceae bacterium]|nr:single-stranded DNA-binding protein [Gemmataceae bacterium]